MKIGGRRTGRAGAASEPNNVNLPIPVFAIALMIACCGGVIAGHLGYPIAGTAMTYGLPPWAFRSPSGVLWRGVGGGW